MKVMVLCPYPENRAPSQRLKFEQYYSSWRAAGWEVDVRPFWDEGAWETLYQKGSFLAKVSGMLRGFRNRLQDMRDASRVNLIYVHLDVVPLGPPLFENHLVRSGIPVIYDIDDMVHLPHHSAGNPFMGWARGRGRVKALLAGANEVIVCTPSLEEMARRYNERVTDISSTIETRKYEVRQPSNATEGVVVGWSGSHSTAPSLHLLDDALKELSRTDGIRLRVIGDPEFSLEGVEVEALPWRAESEVADLQGIDIGLYPLPREPWALGKSGLKALQYMGVGLPVVAERFGTNDRVVVDEETGFLVTGKEEWLERLRLLIRDPELRVKMGLAGRARVEDRYSVLATESVYLTTLRSALLRPRK